MAGGKSFERVHDTLNGQQVAYKQMDDVGLIDAVQQGDSTALDFLIRKYRGFVRAKASTYFLVGADYDDLIQEGMIGLYKAIRDYKQDKEASFKAFAEVCVTRQIITAIKSATRMKHGPLNSYVSLDKPVFDEDSERTLIDVIANQQDTVDPEALLISRERYQVVEEKLGAVLSELEREVLMLYLDGRSYQEISELLDRHVKAIDNALQRIKKKFERHLEDVVVLL
ncbi:RNA polymerase sporulation sigma factor SigH [Halolactibacillus sp. JCM 19043]|uniref:RNA polymerase sporulation sigma factor SigH n=1 Tax=Halolactibacillus sp. JCM 19043 TaxID=1460638 RepID=UPI002101230A|nr:RNA polymerase sporulation sigma factor SigH [Halolactibacillus sp. JCM 19043]